MVLFISDPSPSLGTHHLISGGGGARVFVACKLFFLPPRENNLFFLAINVEQFFFNVLSKIFFVVCFPYYVDKKLFFSAHIFNKLFFLTFVATNYFFKKLFFSAHIFNKLFFLTFVATNYFFQFFPRPLPPPPPQISNGASLS